ncbi:MAG: class I SAM-dependent methyltransferase [Anaerolineales bacterium]|nr:class I SAM-dependent methyltransferase [Anaerolineales bacterium]
MENIDELKKSTGGSPKYRLSNADVFVSPGGYHFIDYLDSVEEISPQIDGSGLTDEEVAYIEKSLQSNPERFENQVNAVKKHMPVKNKAVLDIGCGGGLFLSKLQQEGAVTTGIELSDTRAHYAKTNHGLEIFKRPIEADPWKEHHGSFDVVTLWDVLEHVNFPFSTLQSAANMLKSGGILLIDTPCRDAFYHRMGEFTYWLSRGQYPTFLNTMYSSHMFGHKQILSLSEMREMLEAVGMEIVELRKFHELSFPYSFYLKKMFKSDLIVKMMLPVVQVCLTIFPIRNKMLAVGRKK